MLPVKWVSRTELLTKYVARFKDLHGAATGLPDSEIEGHRKTILNVFGFDPPKGANAVNPVGDDARAVIKPKAGFSVGFLKSKPRNGPVMHNHNTNETFIPLQGTWRFIWEESAAHEEFVDLEPYDTISFPPGVPRRFENLAPSPGWEEGLLIAIVGEDAPISEAMPGVKALLMSMAKGELPTISGDLANPPLLTTKNGGFGG